MDIENFSSKTQKFTKDAEKIPQVLVAEYKFFKSEQMRYLNIAKKLGIEFALPTDNPKIDLDLEKIANNIAEMKRRISEIELTESSSLETIQTALQKLEDYDTSLVDSYKGAKDLSSIIAQYSKESLDVLKKGVDRKVQAILQKTKLELLERKKKEVEDRKITFFGRIRGLNKLKNLELESIDLQMKLIRNTPNEFKSSYSIRDTLADIRVFSITELGGQLTGEMEDIQSSLESVFGVDKEEVKKIALNRMSTGLMVIANPGKKEKTSEKISRMTSNNEDLKVEVSKAQRCNCFVSRMSTYSPQDFVRKFYRVIDDIAIRTSLHDDTGEQTISNENAQIGNDWLTK